MNSPASPGRLVLVRHGESTFNADQIFTGLLDVPLSQRGTEQTQQAAKLLATAEIHPALLVSSPLRRALDTATGLRFTFPTPPELATDWRLAERDYGCLTGISKKECRKRWGDDAFFTWRRTLDGKPPAADAAQRATWGGLAHAGLGPLRPGDSESLRDVVHRVQPLWQVLKKRLFESPETIMVVAHGNSLRALCLLISQLSDDEVEHFNIPAAQPLVFEFNSRGLPLRRLGYYLDPVTAQLEAEKVAAEGGT